MMGGQGYSGYYPFQEGGIVTRPTRAIIGEAGPEAVIPLNSKMGKNITINYNPTINMTNEISNDVDIDTIKKKLSEDLIREVYSELRR